ncbi:MAG: amino acid transporter [Chloroflexota bacterium]|nr:amino acid transporter [Chloroflexota bacterium]
MSRITVDALPGLKNWNPLSPTEAGALFQGFAGTWCIAGGWAIDLFAGGQSRPHADIDIQIDRNAVPMLHQHLPGWLLYAAHGDLTPWAESAPFPDEVHDIWCRRPGNQWEFQLMVVELNDREWVFRRDARIHGPRDAMILSIGGLPILAPEIQLLYKSRLPNRSKAEHDFDHIPPHLTAAQREWLASRLMLLYGDHPWMQSLRETR